MNFKTLTDALENEIVERTRVKEENTLVSSVAFDSREVTKDGAFVAITGVKTDGHLYIKNALEKGASLIVCENKTEYDKYKNENPNVLFLLVKRARRALAIISRVFYGCADEKMEIIGITGTKGKTSTSFMIAKILNNDGKRCGIIGTTGAYFEDFYHEMNHSTPESRDLHALFAKMYSLGATHIVMEVSSQALLMDRVYGIRFSTAIFTNISPDHIGEGEHKDFADYLYCKSKLFSMCKRAVVNADSDRAETILDVCRKNNVPTVTYSCKDETCDFYANNEKFYIDSGMKTSFDVAEKDGEKYSVSVSVPGKFSVFNALCALSVARIFNIKKETVKKALCDVKVIGRTELVDNEKLKCPVIIDYAHNAMSLESLFFAVKAYNPKRIICVFGCGGNRSKLRRYEMGEISGKNADVSIITADNSRFESLDDIISDILVGMNKTNGKYEIVKDRREAIYRAIDISEEGDVVLLAGKGQETYMEIEGVKYHFDEREVVNSYFER